MSNTAYRVYRPENIGPLIVSSPHSGRDYSPFDPSRLICSHEQLRNLEDVGMDQVSNIGHLAQDGIAAIEFLLPRSFIDVNRAPTSLDISQIHDYLPRLKCIPDKYTALGAGLIPVSAKVEGFELYKPGLEPTALEIIERMRAYRGYHRSLKSLMRASLQLHGGYALIDMHSCYPVGPRNADGHALERADIILGDRHGLSCRPEFLHAVRQVYEDHGLTAIAVNTPFPGGYITQSYGASSDTDWSRKMAGRLSSAFHMQALQIEINKRLYLEKDLLTPVDAHVRELQEINRKVFASAEQNIREYLAGPSLALAAA